jgi:hypothetical protein
MDGFLEVHRRPFPVPLRTDAADGVQEESERAPLDWCFVAPNGLEKVRNAMPGLVRKA